MSDPDRALRAAAEAVERALSRRKGLRQELDEIRNVHHAEQASRTDEDSSVWAEYEYPIIVEIMSEAARDGVSAYLSALLGEIPPRSTEALMVGWMDAHASDGGYEDFAKRAAERFLQSLLDCVSERAGG